jgi:pimeloyl-ACP methyl ester carboxylesterase
MKRCLMLVIFALALALPVRAAEGIRLENTPYPFPVTMFKLVSQNQELEMAYMDVPALNPGAEVIVLLHGKNFNSAYWRETALALRDAGYRLIIPDEVGFGKSA